VNLYSIIKDKSKEFKDTCKQHSVKKLYAFGSSITNSFDKNTSDIDLVVDLSIKDPIEEYGEALLSFWDSLEAIFGRRVDLLTEDSINNAYLRKSIEASKQLIYDGQGEARGLKLNKTV